MKKPLATASALSEASNSGVHLTDNNPEYYEPSGLGHWGTSSSPSFDCAMRKLAYTFGKQLKRKKSRKFESRSASGGNFDLLRATTIIDSLGRTFELV